MNSKDVITAIECCLSGGCRKCPRIERWRMDAWTCRFELMKEVYAFIEHLQAENERLKTERDDSYADGFDRGERTGVKQYVKMLRKRVTDVGVHSAIDCVAKEMGIDV